MPRNRHRSRSAYRRAKRRAEVAAATYGDAPDPIFRHCPTCGASPRVNCRTRDFPPTVGNYHPARYEAASDHSGAAAATTVRTVSMARDPRLSR